MAEVILPPANIMGAFEWVLFATGLIFGSVVFGAPLQTLAENLYHADTTE